MSHGRSSLVQQARAALQAGQRERAWQLAQSAARQDPNDHHAWLLLAALAATPAQSVAYVQRAEMLRPDDPTVQKARRWAEKRQVAAPQPQAKRRWWPTAVFTLALVGIFSLFVLAAYLTAPSWRPALTANQPAAALAAATPLPTSAIPPTPIMPAAALATDSQNRVPPTWTATPSPTITPTPTITPIPSPTLAPTYLSPQNLSAGQRPLGVGPQERWIDIDLSRQTLYAYEGDGIVFTTAISSGTATHPTVTGMFRIYLRYERQTMNGYLLGYDYYLENVPHVMYFYQDYALHGAYWHNNFGYPMSHGCVNLDEPDAAWLYDWATYGTVVNVHN